MDRAPSVLQACAALVCTESRWPCSFARTAAQQGPLVQPASDTVPTSSCTQGYPAHSFFVSTELDSSNQVAAVAVRNWRTRRICSCLSARRGAECPEAEIKNKTHVNPLGAAPETRQEPEAGRLRTRGERANDTRGRPTEGGTAKREDRRLCDGGNAPSPLHLLPCFCGGSI